MKEVIRRTIIYKPAGGSERGMEHAHWMMDGVPVPEFLIILHLMERIQWLEESAIVVLTKDV